MAKFLLLGVTSNLSLFEFRLQSACHSDDCAWQFVISSAGEGDDLTNVDDLSRMKESTDWPKHYNGAIYLPFSCDAALCRGCDERRTPMAADYRQKKSQNELWLETTCRETYLMARALSWQNKNERGDAAKMLLQIWKP